MRILLLSIIVLLTACGGGRAVAPIGNSDYSKAPQVKYASSKPPTIYKVKKGDTLYSISWRYGMNYKTLAKINNIRSPYLLSIGKKLRFIAVKPTKKTTTKPKPVTNKKLTWQWPTKGKILSTYSTKANNRKGIKIAGKAGQSIVAAAAGKVVYGGNGLPRYGNLLIVKHNDIYLSAYAHNTELLVKEGDYVKAGQKIATLGRTGTQHNQLHFEVRRNGKPVDPMQFLPKR